jgi:hypothetical protein
MTKLVGGEEDGLHAFGNGRRARDPANSMLDSPLPKWLTNLETDGAL